VGTGAGPHTVCPSSTTTYTVTITDNNGKTVTAASVVSVTGAPVFSVVKTDAGCTADNGTATVTVPGGSGTYSYNWSSGGTSSSVSGLAPGVYTVTVTGSGGCPATATVSVGQITLGITASAVDAECKSQNGKAELLVTGGIAPYTYVWTPGVASGNSASLLAPGVYTVSISDGSGCASAETVIIGEKKCGVVIPNIFTPVGDGINDKFIIEGIDDYPGSGIHIYNRWGTLVYESPDYRNEWDGRAMKSLNRLNEGVYYYVLKLSDGTVNTGFVTLVRGYKF
jgi:gliding motility-associated-like protein